MFSLNKPAAAMLVEEEVAVKRLVRSEAGALERVAISHPARIQRIATADQQPDPLAGSSKQGEHERRLNYLKASGD